MVLVVAGLVPVDRVARLCTVYRIGGLGLVGRLGRLLRLAVLRGLGLLGALPAVRAVLPGRDVLPLGPRADGSAAGGKRDESRAARPSRRVRIAVTGARRPRAWPRSSGRGPAAVMVCGRAWIWPGSSRDQPAGTSRW